MSRGLLLALLGGALWIVAALLDARSDDDAAAIAFLVGFVAVLASRRRATRRLGRWADWPGGDDCGGGSWSDGGGGFGGGDCGGGG